MPLKLSFLFAYVLICLRKGMMASSGIEKNINAYIFKATIKIFFHKNKMYEAHARVVHGAL